MNKLKLIWDFRGPDAPKIAEHHVVHLKEYIATQQTELNIVRFEKITDFHFIAFMVVNENEMKPIRDALKPHRGQLYKL